MSTVTKKPEKYGRRYPWAKWFARGSFVLRAGRDFNGRAYTMAQQVRTAAGSPRFRLSVSIVISDDSGSIAVVVTGRLPPLKRRKRPYRAQASII